MDLDTSLYDGDPVIILTEDGLDIYMNNGDIPMDSFIHNAVQLSFNVDSDNGHHNALMDSPENNFIGKTQSAMNGPITLETLSGIEKLIECDLALLVSQGLIKNLNVIAENTDGKRIHIKIDYEFHGERIKKEFVYEHGKIEVL